MRRSVCVALALALLSAPVMCLSSEKSEAKDPFGYNPKDPILAGALSWFVPGLGQMYSGAILKGAVFFVVEETLLVSTVLTFTEFTLDVTGNAGIGLKTKSNSGLDEDERRNAVILSVSLVVVHFVNIIDAVNTARKYNRVNAPYVSTNLDHREEGDVLSIAVNKPF